MYVSSLFLKYSNTLECVEAKSCLCVLVYMCIKITMQYGSITYTQQEENSRDACPSTYW